MPTCASRCYRDGIMHGRPAQATVRDPCPRPLFDSRRRPLRRVPRSHLRLSLRPARTRRRRVDVARSRDRCAVVGIALLPWHTPVRVRRRPRPHRSRGAHRRRDMRWCSRPSASHMPWRSTLDGFAPRRQLPESRTGRDETHQPAPGRRWRTPCRQRIGPERRRCRSGGRGGGHQCTLTS